MKQLLLTLLGFLFLSANAQLELPKGLQVPSAFALPTSTEANQKVHTRISLLSDHETVTPGSSFQVALRLEMDPHWHTYWEYPGDSGLATTLEWTLPEGVTAGTPQWPTPQTFTEDSLVTYGYETEAFVLIPLYVAETATPGTVTLSVNATWLECKGMCLPGDDTASTSMTIGPQAAKANQAISAQFEMADSRIPTNAEGWILTSERKADSITLSLRAPAGTEFAEPTEFFPRNELLWNLAKGFQLAKTGSGVRITGFLQVDPVIPEQFDGVLAFREGALDLENASRDAEGPATPPAANNGADFGLAGALGLAFLGGLLLNLMPCVFPVLGLKISGFVHQAHGDMKKAKIHGWIFALGIFLSMQVLAVVVSTLNLAWGQQFQSVGMNVGITLLFFALALNLFGVFEIGTRMTTVGGNLQTKSGYAGSFYSGLLVTLAATPCTAPLLGVALGWAAGQPPFTIFLFFSALSLGMALPYVILSNIPALMEKVPAPGAWMETFKQAMGFLIAAFVMIWIWVLAGQIPVTHLLTVLSSLLLIALAGWIYGKWCLPHRSRRSRSIAALLALFLAATAIVRAVRYEAPETTLTAELQAKIDNGTPLLHEELSPELSASLQAGGTPVHWRPWSPELVRDLNAAGTPVFVDFTARWCLTCQLNKKTTLRKEDVLTMFEEAGVVTLMADWTNRDVTIFDTIRSLGRNGVPVYALHPGEAGGAPTLLPETLTPQIIEGALDKLTNQRESE